MPQCKVCAQECYSQSRLIKHYEERHIEEGEEKLVPSSPGRGEQLRKCPCCGLELPHTPPELRHYPIGCPHCYISLSTVGHITAYPFTPEGIQAFLRLASPALKKEFLQERTEREVLVATL